MNGPTVSIIGSIGIGLAGVIVGWLASHNIIPVADVSADTAVVGTIIVGAIGAAVAWFKAQSQTKAALIKSVNADPTNGVKVVSVASPSKQVDEPIPTTPTVAK